MRTDLINQRYDERTLAVYEGGMKDEQVGMFTTQQEGAWPVNDEPRNARFFYFIAPTAARGTRATGRYTIRSVFVSKPKKMAEFFMNNAQDLFFRDRFSGLDIEFTEQEGAATVEHMKKMLNSSTWNAMSIIKVHTHHYVSLYYDLIRSAYKRPSFGDQTFPIDGGVIIANNADILNDTISKAVDSMTEPFKTVKIEIEVPELFDYSTDDTTYSMLGDEKYVALVKNSYVTGIQRTDARNISELYSSVKQLQRQAKQLEEGSELLEYIREKIALFTSPIETELVFSTNKDVLREVYSDITGETQNVKLLGFGNREVGSFTQITDYGIFTAIRRPLIRGAGVTDTNRLGIRSVVANDPLSMARYFMDYKKPLDIELRDKEVLEYMKKMIRHSMSVITVNGVYYVSLYDERLPWPKYTKNFIDRRVTKFPQTDKLSSTVVVNPYPGATDYADSLYQSIRHIVSPMSRPFEYITIKIGDQALIQSLDSPETSIAFWKVDQDTYKAVVSNDYVTQFRNVQNRSILDLHLNTQRAEADIRAQQRALEEAQFREKLVRVAMQGDILQLIELLRSEDASRLLVNQDDAVFEEILRNITEQQAEDLLASIQIQKTSANAIIDRAKEVIKLCTSPIGAELFVSGQQVDRGEEGRKKRIKVMAMLKMLFH